MFYSLLIPVSVDLVDLEEIYSVLYDWFLPTSVILVIEIELL